MSYQLIDTHSSFGSNVDGTFVHHKQVITDDFLETLKSERHAKAHMKHGEMNRVASVPTFLVELWQRQGFNIYEHSPREIVARLQAHDLQAFITTPKSV